MFEEDMQVLDVTSEDDCRDFQNESTPKLSDIDILSSSLNEDELQDSDSLIPEGVIFSTSPREAIMTIDSFTGKLQKLGFRFVK